MRFIHTADWHLGRILHGVHLTEDQAYVLERLVDLAGEARADAVLVCGDVYDRAAPPPEAVDLLDHVLSRIVLEKGIPVVLIAGNHDSPARLSFGARLLEGGGLHIAGRCEAEPLVVRLEDRHGAVHLFGLPYAEPALVRERLGRDDLPDHQAALAARVEGIRGRVSKGGRSVLLAHAFTAGGAVSESERPLSVGGAGCVDAALFDGFHYAALGHLHRPQEPVPGRVAYSGSLMKYAFSEAEHEKSVAVIEMDEAGACRVERVPLRARRDVRRVEGYFHDLLERPLPPAEREDYLEITLLDPGPVLDALARLREVYPNVLSIFRRSLDPRTGGEGRAPGTGRRDTTELFQYFYEEVTGEALPEEGLRTFREVVESLEGSEREAGS